MDLNALALFAEAARSGSLSEAARRTGVPLPTLSRRVRKLEDELGIRLLERGPTGLALTQAGTRLLAEAEPALAILSQAKQRLHDESGIAGTLRISLPPQFDHIWPVFTSFVQRHPAVRLDVFATDRRIDLVADGVDVAIRHGVRGHSSYKGRTVLKYRHRVVASPRLLDGLELKQPEDLQNVPCACWRSPEGAKWTLGGTQMALDPVLAVNDYEHLLYLATTGQAVTEVPPFKAHSRIRSGQLVEVLPDHPMPQQPLRLLVVETRGVSPLVRSLLDHAATAVPEALEPFIW